MRFKDRIGKLEKRNGPQGGGVVFQLPGGGYKYRGRYYEDLAALPYGGGVLVIPETLPPEQWDRTAVKVHQEQEQLIMEKGK
jgi:hypothetical protein